MLHPASSKESLLYSLVPTYMGKDIKFHFQGLPDISVSDASRFQWARVHMCCRSVLMMPWRPWVSLKNMGCHEAPHNPDNLLTRGLPSKASLLITPSGLIGLYWCLLCSPVSEAVANVCTPQFSSLLLYCTGVLFWQRNVNQPLTKANSEVKKKKKARRKSTRVPISMAKRLDWKRWKMQSWEPCPMQYFGVSLARVKVKSRGWCFVSCFFTESAFPSKEVLTKENKGNDCFILYQHKMCSIVLIEAICFRGWSSVEIK